MNKESLFDIYPWYRQHQQAVDTVAAYLAIEVEQVLKGLDEKINGRNRPTVFEPSKAA